MADQTQNSQPVNAGAPLAPSASEVAAAKSRLAELKSNAEWGRRYVIGGNESAEGRELDRLQQIVFGGRNTAASQPATPGAMAAPSASPTTPEAARERLADLLSDYEWSARLLGGDVAIKNEHERLLRIAHGNEEMRQRAISQTSGGPITTAAQARTRLEELRTDPVWSKKFMAGGRAERREFDNLTALAAQPDAAKPDDAPTEKPDLSVYQLPPGVRVDDSEASIENFNVSRELAAEHGLTPGAYAGIVEEQVKDEARFATMTPDEVGEKLCGDLGKMWGADYDRHVENIQRFLGENRALEAQLQRLVGYGPERWITNKVVFMELSILAAKKYGLRR